MSGGHLSKNNVSVFVETIMKSGNIVFVQ